MASRSRLRSTAVPLGLTAVLAASLTGCSEQPEDSYAAICADQTTEERVEDYNCDDDGYDSDGHYYGWYFIPYRGTAAAIGSRVSGGSFSKPDAAYVKGVPAAGGAVSDTIRSGFGSRVGGKSFRIGG